MTLFGSLPGTDPQYQNASDTSRRALMEYKFVQLELDDLAKTSERRAEKITGLKSSELAYFLYLSPLLTQQISTKPFNNLKYDINGFSLRPEVTYNFYGPETLVMGIYLTKGF